jgi:hypothetical protein
MPTLDIPENTVLSRNGTLWDLHPPAPSRRPSRNIVSTPFRFKGGAEDANLTRAEILKLMLGPQIISHIVKQTNTYAEQYVAKQKASKPLTPDWIPTDETEMYAFLGLLLLAGVERSR